MRFKPLLMAVVLLVTSELAIASPKESYLRLLDKKDYPALEAQLQKWMADEPNNPEVYIAYFNYHLKLAMKSGMSIDQKPKAGQTSMVITDPKTNEPVGYLNGSTFYDDVETRKALEFLYTGLEIAPDRLDIYFGITHIKLQILDFDGAADTLLAAFKQAGVNGGKWLWSDDKPVKDGERFLLENVQDYYNTMFEDESPAALDAIEAIAKAQIEAFPGHSWAYANLATVLSWTGREDEAMALFLKAYELDPNDLVNVNNLANAYRNAGNKELAIQYYTIILNSGNKEYAEYARKMLDKVNSN
jgi:tetratricopeptide (TPR) repeat protein